MSNRIASYLTETASDLFDVINARTKSPASGSGQAKRVTRIQFGDYQEAYDRLAGGGSENYYAQRRSVAFTGELVQRPDVESVTMVSLSKDIAPTQVGNGVHVSGVELYRKGGRARKAELINAVALTRPTHLIVELPFLPLISWGVNSGLAVAVMLADSFRSTGLRATLQHKMLKTLLNASAIGMVSNHNLAASLDLYRIGVDPAKIVPYDWPALISPRDFPEKSACSDPQHPRLLYVGVVIEEKGVGDVLNALKLLRQRGLDARLTIMGRGEVEAFRQRAATLGLAECTEFTGLRSHDEVVAAMRDHDVVLVPSRWNYPEGLPMTLYEALCTRTPLITSDHPMFGLKIKDRQNALVFHEQHAEGCARCVEELVTTPSLYAKLSHNAEEAADGFLCPTKFDRVISDFLDGNSQELCRSASLRSSYPQQLTGQLAS